MDMNCFNISQEILFISGSNNVEVVHRNARATDHNMDYLGLTSGLSVQSLSPLCSLRVVYNVCMAEL